MSQECPECFGTGYGASESDREPCGRCHATGKVEPYYIGEDYGVDLNAMHKAERDAKTGDPEEYGKWLIVLTRKTGTHPWCADAEQRREAFLRVFGLFREETK